MPIAIELPSVTPYKSLTERSPVGTLIFVNRNQRRVPFVFFDEGKNMARELAAGSSGDLLVKRKGQFASNAALARSSTWVREGSGANAVYWFNLNLATAEMNTAFSANPESLTDLVVELNITENGAEQTAPALDCTIYNRYLQPAEGQLPSVNPPWPQPASIFSLSDLVTATIPAYQSYVDFDVTAAALTDIPTTLLSMGVRKPSAGAENIGIVSVVALNAQTLRAYLTAAPSEEGYTATVFFKP